MNVAHGLGPGQRAANGKMFGNERAPHPSERAGHWSMTNFSDLVRTNLFKAARGKKNGPSQNSNQQGQLYPNHPSASLFKERGFIRPFQHMQRLTESFLDRCLL